MEKNYLDNYNIENELINLSNETVKEWIEDEWEELYHVAGSNRGETTSIIIDGYYKWMKVSLENEVFVYKTLLDLNRKITNNKNDEVIVSLDREIKELMKKE